jgi:hypothetical protein
VRLSAEAEYRAMTSTTRELIWMKQLLKDLNITTNILIKLFYDNQATCRISSNLVFHERTKYIELYCHCICEKIQVKEIESTFVGSKDQLADIFIKSLEPSPFKVNIN